MCALQNYKMEEYTNKSVFKWINTLEDITKNYTKCLSIDTCILLTIIISVGLLPLEKQKYTKITEKLNDKTN